MHAALAVAWALLEGVGCEMVADLDRFQPPAGGSGGAGAAGSGGGATSASGGGATACGVAQACVPQPPRGWTPIHLSPGAADRCATPTAGGLDVTAQPSTCPSCACATAEGGTCGAVPITLLWDGSSCGGSPSCTEPSQVASGSCLSTLLCSTPTWANGVVIDQIPVDGGTCQSTTMGEADHPAPTFVDEHTACAIELTPTGCPAGLLCAPNPPAGFIPRYCVSSPTALDECPIEYPHERMVLYTDHDDTRACTACGCAAPTAHVCPGTATRYSEGACAGGGNALGYTPGLCVGLTNVDSIRVDVGSPGGGTCAKTGGVVEGGVTRAAPLKVCCTEP